MTVVVLDPRSPELIPLAARSSLTGTVLVTEDVPASVLWELDRVEPVAADSDDALTLLTTDSATRRCWLVSPTATGSSRYLGSQGASCLTPSH